MFKHLYIIITFKRGLCFMPKRLVAEGINKCIGCFSCMLACAAVNEKSHSINNSRLKIRTKGGLQSKFIAITCRACKEPACFEACKHNALKLRPGGGVICITENCVGCKACVEACVMKAVFFNESTKKAIICKHCGVCTKFCPHGCLKMEDVNE
jgi:Fe-S-cluster-containing dehydrogenase component